MIKFPPMQLASTVAGFRLRQFLSLTKPRVVSLIVFCAVIGMYLAAPGWVPPKLLLAATLGIWLVAGAAAAVNCLVEQKIEAVMTRGRARRRRAVGALQPRQSAYHVAHFRHVHRLRGDLHGSAQADDSAEHRHRR